MKISRICISTLLLAGLVAATGWWARYYLLQNHVLYLLNQKEPAEAKELITRLDSENQSNDRTKYLMKKVLIVNGDFLQAAKLPDTGQYDAEMLYWEAVAAYHTGRLEVSSRRAKEFLKSGARLPDAASYRIARSLAGENVSWGRQPEKTEGGFGLLFDVEKAACFALAGLEEYNRRNFTDAARLYERAVSLGYRDPQAMKQAAKAAALDSSFQRADLFLNFCAAGTTDMLYSEFLQGTKLPEVAPVGIDILTDQRGENRQAYLHALSWILPYYVARDVDSRGTVTVQLARDLAQASPDDAILKLGLARTLETLGRNDEAVAVYEYLRRLLNSLDINVKCWALSGKDVAGMDGEIEALVRPLNPLQFKVYPEVCSVTDHAILAVPFSLQVTEPGTFAFTVIGRAGGEGEKRPLLQLNAGTATTGYYCMPDDSWGCHTIVLTLDAGTYPVELRVANSALQAGQKSAQADIKAVLVTNYDIR